MKKITLMFAFALLGCAAIAQDVYEQPAGTANEAISTQDRNTIINVSFPTEQGMLSFAMLSDEERAGKIDVFLMTNKKYLPKNKIGIIRETLMGLSDEKLKNVLLVADGEFKDPTVALVLSLFLGSLGIDRFYIGDTGAGIGKLLTFGGLGIWAFIDWFIISGRARDKNYQELMGLCEQLNY